MINFSRLIVVAVAHEVLEKILDMWRSSMTCSLLKSKQTGHESAMILQILDRFCTRVFVLSVIFDLFYSLEYYIRGVFEELKNDLWVGAH